MSSIVAASIYSEKVQALECRSSAVSAASAHLLTALKTHSVSLDAVPPAHQKVVEAWTRLQKELGDCISSCCDEIGGVKTDAYEDFLKASELQGNAQESLKQLNRTIRTLFPEYLFATTDVLASERKPFASLLASTPAKAPFMTTCLAKSGLNPSALEYREILGDGNCFYSSIVAHILDSGLIDEFLAQIPSDLPLSPALLHSVRSSLEASKTNPEVVIRETNLFMQCIRLMREIASYELLRNQTRYQDQLRISLSHEFPLEEADIWAETNYENLVSKYTREMGKEASFPTIVALANFLSLPVMIHQIGLDKPICTQESALIDLLNPRTIHVFRTGEHYYLLHAIATKETVSAPVASVSATSAAPSETPAASVDPELPMSSWIEAVIDVGLGNKLVLVGNGSIVQSDEVKDLQWDDPQHNGIPLTCSSSGKVWSLVTQVLIEGECKVCLVEASGKVLWSSGPNLELKQGCFIPVPSHFE